MELIYSSVLPVKFPKTKDFRSVFERELLATNQMLIATGYVSEDSLMELKAMLQYYNGRTQKKECDLVIGMHGREGFTRSQYDAACSLGEFLRDEKIGEVRVCTAFKFHGKVYSFLKSNKPVSSIIGSSNLSDIIGTNLQWETDALVREKPMLKGLVEMHRDLVKKATCPVLDLSDVKFISHSDLLNGRIGVERVSENELRNVLSTEIKTKFVVPLKAELKSNLNVYFGKGRESKNGAIRPRPWYEVEVIVPKAMTSLPGYPTAGRPFQVYTDDGWKFRCKVSGQNDKNLRSEEDLQTLGRWIKGRLEESGVLKIGQMITENTLESYGTNELLLSATNNPEIWILDFSPKHL